MALCTRQPFSLPQGSAATFSLPKRDRGPLFLDKFLFWVIFTSLDRFATW